MKRFSKEKSKRFQIRDKIFPYIALLVLSALLLCACTQTGTQYDVKCVFLEAGQGDASLITTREGYSVMIDTGVVGYTDKIISSLIAGNISKLDLLILTHNHEDHVGGAVEILENFKVKQLWCIESGDNYITSSIESTAKQNGTSVKFVNSGDELTVGKNIPIKLKVLCAYAEGSASDENENSIIVSAAYGDFKALYMADAGLKTEKYLLENCKEEISCDILKVAHHGSDSASSEEFIKEAAPQIAVISCEKNNQYAHPHKQTLDTLDKYCKFTAATYNGNFEVLVKDGEIIFNNKY